MGNLKIRTIGIMIAVLMTAFWACASSNGSKRNARADKNNQQTEESQLEELAKKAMEESTPRPSRLGVFGV